MCLWVDKHRSKRLAKLDYHIKQAEHLDLLLGLARRPESCVCPGRFYGARVERLRIEHQNFLTPSMKKIEIITIASNYHIEVNPSDVMTWAFTTKLSSRS